MVKKNKVPGEDGVNTDMIMAGRVKLITVPIKVLDECLQQSKIPKKIDII